VLRPIGVELSTALSAGRSGAGLEAADRGRDKRLLAPAALATWFASACHAQSDAPPASAGAGQAHQLQ